jgi:hypothetical protein
MCGANAKHTRMSGMRRNPRHNGSERAGSRPHEANLLTLFNEYMDVCSFSFPVVFWFVFCLSLGSEQTKNLPGRSPLSVLEPSAVILNFAFKCQYFFFESFSAVKFYLPPLQRRASEPVDVPAIPEHSKLRFGIAPCIAVCVGESVPVASGAWHALVWAKVLAR